MSSREWEPTEVFQECPDGMVATGGGYELHGDGALVVKVVGSGPATAMGGGAVWRVLLLAAPQAQFTSVSVTVWAVCGPE